MDAYDPNALNRPVNMTLNEDLVRRARAEQVEKSVTSEQRRRLDEDGRLDAAIDASNAFYDAHGSFADDHSIL